MNYLEFNHLKLEIDPKNPFCSRYVYPNGEVFYIEPAFYTQLEGFKTYHADKYDLIIKRIEEVVLKNKKVVFVGNFEFPQTEVEEEGYIYLEITDITDPLKIYAEDKSRGSDYGD